MIEIRRCKFGSGREGVGVFVDNSIISWTDWDTLENNPIKLTISHIKTNVD